MYRRIQEFPTCVQVQCAALLPMTMHYSSMSAFSVSMPGWHVMHLTNDFNLHTQENVLLTSEEQTPPNKIAKLADFGKLS